MNSLDRVPSSAQTSTAAGSLPKGNKGAELNGPGQVYAQAVGPASIAARFASFSKPVQARPADEHKDLSGAKSVTQRVDFFTRLQTSKAPEKRTRGQDQSHTGPETDTHSSSGLSQATEPGKTDETPPKRTKRQEMGTQGLNPAGAGMVSRMATSFVQFQKRGAVILPRPKQESSASGQNHAGAGLISHRVSTFPPQMKKASELTPMDEETSSQGASQAPAGSIAHRVSAFPRQIKKAPETTSEDQGALDQNHAGAGLISHRVSSFPKPPQMSEAPPKEQGTLGQNHAGAGLISHRVSSFPKPPQMSEALPKEQGALGQNHAGAGLISHRVSAFPGRGQMGKAVDAAPKEQSAPGPSQIGSHRVSALVIPAHMSIAPQPAPKETPKEPVAPVQVSIASRLSFFPKPPQASKGNGTKDQS